MQLGKKLLRSRRLQMLQREIKTFLGTGINSYNSASTDLLRVLTSIPSAILTKSQDSCTIEHGMGRSQVEHRIVY